MYTITFYSFKGGVGRTLALVNVAVELARLGRKVLLVDFDLEAPGLETFDLLRPDRPRAGVVEYVTDYLHTGTSPLVTNYLYKASTIGKKNGQLWVMPAGRGDMSYRHALARIDWIALYAKHDGFLFFEDTKQQWQEFIRPDYVLIDARTGHSDIQGICTRHLPDAVVALFFPNEQNLAGLKDVCQQIRGEAETGLKKAIRLHFVMSNVPDLEDKDKILQRRLQSFRQELGIPRLSSTIHRYESMMLLNQAVFVRERPHSRLAREYRRLVKALIVENPADRDGALLFMREMQRDYSQFVDRIESKAHERRLEQIISHFQNAPELLVKAAQCRIAGGHFDSALPLLDKALEMDPNLPPALFQRASCRHRLGNIDGAVEDLIEYLQTPGIDTGNILRALRELQAIAPDRAVEAVDLPAVRALSGAAKNDVTAIVGRTSRGIDCAIRLLQAVVADPREDLAARGDAAIRLALYLVHQRRWQEAIDLLEPPNNDLSAINQAQAFNLAMAWWGQSGTLRLDLCRLILEKDSVREVPAQSPAYYQGLALIWWRLGEISKAGQCLETAAEMARQQNQPLFSCWCYQVIAPDQFQDDCQQIRRLIAGEPLRPAFLVEASHFATAEVVEMAGTIEAASTGFTR